MEDVSQKICLTVLEEDLRALIEECEEHLIGDVAVEETSVDSLESRGLTVLEELESLSGH
jgi:3-dehydroquinate dehydratase